MGCAYLLAWGPLLLALDGVWWDDWTLVEGQGGIREAFRQLGSWWGPVHAAMISIGPPGYRALSFLLVFFQGILVVRLLKTLNTFSDWESVFFGVVFLVLPLNAARNTMIVFPYTVSLSAFLLAWSMLVHEKKPAVLRKGIAGLLFLVSFSTGSLLVFFVVPIAHLLWLSYSSDSWNIRMLAVSKGWLSVLPVAYYATSRTLFAPFGAFEGYNSLVRTSVMASIALLLLVSIGIALVFSLRARLSAVVQEFLQTVLAGFLLVALAVAPYMAVGHLPPYREWSTRHELLMSFGVAIVFLAILRLAQQVFGPAIAVGYAVVVIIAGTISSAQIGLSYVNDWEKQQALIKLMAEDDSISQHQLIVFNDKTSADNVFGSPYRFYAWTGMLSHAFGESTRFAINSTQIDQYVNGDLRKFYGQEGILDYGARNFIEPQEALIVTVEWSAELGYFLDSEGMSLSHLSMTAD